MSGNMIIFAGIGLIATAVGLEIVSVVYRNTKGKKILAELDREYPRENRTK